METKNENRNAKSLFLYTALIFLVALLMIVVSFFGQSHLESIKETEQKAKNLTEKTSMLSDQNLYLTEQVSSLTKTLEEKDTLLLSTESRLQEVTLREESLNNTLAAYIKMKEKKKAKAKEYISLVNPELLSHDGKWLYDEVIKYTK